MPRILFHAVHYPRPEHLDDLLATMRGLTGLAPHIDGLEAIGAFSDAEGDRIVAVSIWSSEAAFQAGSQSLFASLADVPFDVWERRPRELHVLPEVDLSPPARVA